ncbi:MAG: DMT family transporter [Alphaproteobacteria bacterium]|nr:DMT family transporter [Alphaproteobacteria bacterium]
MLILVWGTNWPIMKIGLRYLTPLQFTAARLALATLCMFALVLAMRRLRLPRRVDMPVVLSVGLVQIGLFLTLVNMALVHVEAGRSAILAYTMPLWVAPMSLILLGERLTPLKLAGLVSGLAGVAVLFNPLGFDWSDRDALLGNGLLMLGALAWAGVIVHLRAHPWEFSPLELAPWQFLVGFLPFLVAALWLDHASPIAWGRPLLAVLIYNGPLATAFAFWAAVTVNRALPAITTSLAFLGVPVVGMIASAVALGEPFTSTKLAGMALILAGLALASLADWQAASGTSVKTAAPPKG